MRHSLFDSKPHSTRESKRQLAVLLRYFSTRSEKSSTCVEAIVASTGHLLWACKWAIYPRTTSGGDWGRVPTSHMPAPSHTLPSVSPHGGTNLHPDKAFDCDFMSCIFCTATRYLALVTVFSPHPRTFYTLFRRRSPISTRWAGNNRRASVSRRR